MNWATLSIAEVAGLFAAAGLLALWLYLRQPRAARLRVSTLRFWESAPSGASTARRWRLREPWAFLAQLLFLFLVIAALGNPRWGIATEGRSVVVVLDAGAWSQMRPGGASWLDQIRTQTRSLLQQLPSNDRVLLLRADLDGEPMLPFTTDRAALSGALATMQSSGAVADVPHALSLGAASLEDGTATSAQKPRGLLVYVGPGLVDEKQARALDEFRQSLAGEPANVTAAPEFLVRLVGGIGPLQDIGITQMALKRNSAAPDEWSVLTQVKNYNNVPARVNLALSVGGHVFREEDVSLAGGATEGVSDDFTSRSGGLLQAEVTPPDDLAADNRATIDLPSSQPVSVAVVTSRANFAAKMRAVLAANPYVKTEFVHAGAAPPASANVVVYDGPVPDGASAPATISFIPAGTGASARRVRLGNWNSTHPVTRWIQSHDVTVRAAAPLALQPGDVVLASSSAAASPEPLIVARQDNRQRSVVADFDPIDSNFTEEASFPLLMAASVEWMTHPIQEQGQFLTAGGVDLPQPISRIVAPSGRDLLFAGDDASVHVFAAESGLYRVTSAGQDLGVPVNVPELPTVRWTPTAAEDAPLEAQPTPIEQQDLWRWLLGLALVALWLEWRLYYFRRVKENAPANAFPLSLGDTQVDSPGGAQEPESTPPAVRTR